MNNLYRSLILPASILAGTIIGAGIFSLPFVFQTAGLSLGFIYLALASVVYIFLHLMYADVIIRTSESHRFVGYAKIYLGSRAFWLSILMTVVEMIFVMTIYLTLSQSFSNLVTTFGSNLEKLLIFWFLGSAAVFMSLRRIALLEFLIVGGILLIISLIFVLGLNNFLNLPAADFFPNFSMIFLPLAPLLFSLSGRVAIPALVDYLKDKPDAVRLVKKSVIVGTLAPAVLYGLFVVGVLGLSSNVSEDAVSGLIGQAPGWILLAVGILGLLSLWSSYIVVGLDINKSLVYDFKLPVWLRFLLVVMAPLLLYLSGFQSFIGLVSFVGGVFLSLEGIFIICMWLKANKVLAKPPVLLKKANIVVIGFLFLILAAALSYEIMK
ncbi:MAG: hypothetical protein A2745_00855 [Candidatus Harrisonbacteria bacterium RIFCSPHIGHO2_01_FULL_44_13]|uniref:Amino acid transporter transmembrane domain-containing protein n=1 Tax=Candidatus Harrisonbacteria bacterium RIFCSPLOWO2_01_FULL_44_18 TaxID=1798407 RepID=A0A1G1ZMD2_9BACT|nr:MAG: hypothetical protein A2745_00855 [Candidatus Harrisonbacteria bacterium RIFCSPHIGHO2_01_FULL_44_13]OGY65685.1 MAG: hypothetical protein A3A16_03660 [Candidatus Harrisonbacteria bacterium RIFCSPLOWO2_01_FULL_44_18]